MELNLETFYKINSFPKRNICKNNENNKENENNNESNFDNNNNISERKIFQSFNNNNNTFSTFDETKKNHTINNNSNSNIFNNDIENNNNNLNFIPSQIKFTNILKENLNNHSEKNSLTEKIIFLENKIKDLNKKFQNDFETLIQQKNFELKKLENEKNNQINFLILKNNELTKTFAKIKFLFRNHQRKQNQFQRKNFRLRIQNQSITKRKRKFINLLR